MQVSPHWCVLCEENDKSQGHIFDTCNPKTFGTKSSLVLDGIPAYPLRLAICWLTCLQVTPSQRRKSFYGCILFELVFELFGWKGIIRYFKKRNSHLIACLNLLCFWLFHGANVHLSSIIIALQLDIQLEMFLVTPVDRDFSLLYPLMLSNFIYHE